MGAAQTDQFERRQFDLETASSGRDEDGLVVHRGHVHHDRQPSAGTERTDPADDETGRPFRVRRFCHDRATAADRISEPLEIEFPIDRDDSQDEATIHRCNERLEDPAGHDAECRRRIAPIARALVAFATMPLGRLVRVQPMRHTRADDDIERTSAGGGHGPIVAISAMLRAAHHPSASIDARSEGRRRAPNGARGGTTQERHA